MYNLEGIMCMDIATVGDIPLLRPEGDWLIEDRMLKIIPYTGSQNLLLRRKNWNSAIA